MSYKLGRRSPKGAPAIHLSNVLTGVVPVIPPSEDYLARLSGWEMLGNDRYGDCVAVTWSNVRRLVSSELGTGEYPALSEVIDFYKTQNPDFPAEDNGMDIQTALEHLVKTGGPDGAKAVCFAKVDHTNVAEVNAAIAIFGSVWTGITVTEANQEQFAAGESWDYDANSPVEGGHSVITGGYGGGSTRFITWAAETGFTASFWQHQVEEAWVVVWPEHLGSASFLAGVNLASLAADYAALTGKEAPFAPVAPPTPDPTPTPAPAPVPEPANPEQLLERLADAIVEWADGIFSRWHPTARDSQLMDAAKAYIEATGREFPGTPTPEDIERRELAG